MIEKKRKKKIILFGNLERRREILSVLHFLFNLFFFLNFNAMYLLMMLKSN